MDKYEKWFQELSDRLKNGDRFGLRMNVEGEGKFKDFQGEHEIPELKLFIENARKENIEDLTVRDANSEKSIISEF
ncbi:MAG: hypothetical protein F3742_12305 [Nitrospinae bacterium]|nr:hypothetical protein [Nitrospinota bacterium]MZH15527.1 hypothetical protein [Nitrospinota bacterium]